MRMTRPPITSHPIRARVGVVLDTRAELERARSLAFIRGAFVGAAAAIGLMMLAASGALP